MKKTRLGRNGPMVSKMGLGCGSFTNLGSDQEQAAIATVQAALDAGINLLNTADFYGMGQSESVIGKAIKGRRDQAFLSVKFGMMRSPSDAFLGLDGRPSAVKNFAAYSLQRLGVDVIDLYQPGRPDPGVPYEDTIGAIADLIKEGKVRYLGVCEVGADHLRRAHAVHPVSALEIEYSLASRFIEPEILPAARELGVGVIAYRVLADGLLSGALTQEPTGAHARMAASRLKGDNLARNLEKIASLKELASRKECTPAQLAVAWLLTRGDDIFALVGMARPARLHENLDILDIRFTAEELAWLDATFANGAILGERYPDFVLELAAR